MMSAKPLLVLCAVVAIVLVLVAVGGIRGELPVQKLNRAIAAAAEEVSSDERYRLVVRPPVGGVFGWCSVDGGAVELKNEFERRHPELRFGDYAVESCVITLKITARPR